MKTLTAKLNHGELLAAAHHAEKRAVLAAGEYNAGTHESYAAVAAEQFDRARQLFTLAGEVAEIGAQYSYTESKSREMRRIAERWRREAGKHAA